MTAKKRRPFHESVISVIKAANSTQLVSIANLLETTVIPKNHALIAAAWLEQCVSFCVDEKFSSRVAQSVLQQGKPEQQTET